MTAHMMPLPWIKLWVEVRTDAKLRSLTDAQFRVWLNALLYAATLPERGTISGTSDRLLAIEVAGGDVALLNETLAVLEELRIVTLGGNGSERFISFINFEKRQERKPSDQPEQTRARKQKERERKRGGVTRVTPLSRVVTPLEEEGKEGSEEEEHAFSHPPTPLFLGGSESARDFARKNDDAMMNEGNGHGRYAIRTIARGPSVPVAEHGWPDYDREEDDNDDDF